MYGVIIIKQTINAHSSIKITHSMRFFIDLYRRKRVWLHTNTNFTCLK